MEMNITMSQDSSDSSGVDPNSSLLEVHSVDFVPHSERHGSARSLFTLWFGANAMGVTLLTGSLAILTNLSLTWSVVAIAIGTLLGSVFVAYHSAQGPVLGLPQMIQSRAQFGMFGANVPLLVVVLMYLGYYGGGAVLAGQAVGELFGVSDKIGIVAISAVSVVLVAFGYNLLHKVAKIITPLFIVTFAILTVSLAAHWSGGGGREVAPSGFSSTGFFLILGIVAAYHITYGPYVADYSRYLPASTSHRATFWYSYAGISLAGIWLMALGAAVQFAYTKLDFVPALAAAGDATGAWFRVLVLVVFIVGLVNIGALNIYGAAMSSLTIVTSYLREWTPTLALRLSFMLGLGAIGTLGASLVSGDFITAYENFIFFLITFLVPWSAINLVDFYVVRQGQYSINALFQPDGEYGRYSKQGLSAYLIGCLALVPFISTDFYTGPIAARLGFDLSWLVGLVIPGLLYAVICRATGLRASVGLSADAPAADALGKN
ncbi:cytosine permease [Streptomyces sp. NPDC051987]|uniref:purine-cytosine permease family protein n=1 Tax=Streptomyces sp. NPDC051987 TaxID=3155808 RepID=UPI00342FA37E